MGTNLIPDWADSLKQPLKDARTALDEAGRAVTPYRNSLEQAITSNPVKAVALALAAGVFLGWLIKRS